MDSVFVLWFLCIPFLVFLLLISLFDLRHYMIPDSLILAIAGLGGFRMLSTRDFFSPLFGALLLFGVFLLLHLLSPEGMGFGDVKFAGAIGFFLGWRLGLLATLLSFFAGGFVGALLVLLRRKTMKDPLPFGPFLAFGAALSFLFGEEVIAWYLGIWM
ncbi:MAG: A24 family peptidase [Candidatus Caldatribacterium sp.]|uniref:prepilin peptidase n=1 Tax=Candidatus Caldatribacterium sp. TaxID=2282143 RepID=UPI002997C8F0|nr:A24 family peptidase [Candidatus Caldatribacterium sp.]MCX7729854.1 A24 family peptidase [Candidatus Caldatribacterium sp.]MDW8081705.1 A24 family peptidase [Candidatus Calescibacterium sp.]